MVGLAAGILTACAIWNLIIPAMERAVQLGGLAFLPALAGVWCGFLVFLIPGRKIWKAGGVLALAAGGISALMGLLAGMMLYTVIQKLIPVMAAAGSEDAGTVCFGAGFTLVMLVDAMILR